MLTFFNKSADYYLYLSDKVVKKAHVKSTNVIFSLIHTAKPKHIPFIRI